MSDTEIIDLTPENIADYGVCGYKDIRKHAELRKKIVPSPVISIREITIKIIPGFPGIPL